MGSSLHSLFSNLLTYMSVFVLVHRYFYYDGDEGLFYVNLTQAEVF